MRESLILATLNEVSIIFEKESFPNAKKVLNFIQSLTNEKKVINPLRRSIDFSDTNISLFLRRHNKLPKIKRSSD